MKLHIARGEKFIPKWNGNDATENPITFHLHYLTPDEREQCAVIYVPVGDTKKGVKVKTDFRELFVLGVEKIENLSIDVDGTEVKIETAKDFLKYPMPEELYQEVAVRVKTSLGVELKN